MSDLLALHTNQWKLIVLPRRNTHHLLASFAQLAAHSPLIVLDCGRQFDSSIVARAARGRQEIIDRIKIQRAFICDEAAGLLERTPAGTIPILVLDFLSTFYDENVKVHTRNFLLERSIQHFRRLSQAARVGVTVQPPAPQDELFQKLQYAAPLVSIYEEQTPDTQQLRLF